MKCLRCGEPMELVKREYLQLGKTGWIGGGWDNLLAGALDVTILACPKCGKLEFFNAGALEPEEAGGRIAQVKCPKCGRKHDMDDPKCPFCGTKSELY